MLSDFCGLVRTRGRNSLINSKLENRRRTSKLPKYFADLSLLNIRSYDIHGVSNAWSAIGATWRGIIGDGLHGWLWSAMSPRSFNI